MVVDAHCHASPQWFEPVEPLVAQMDLNGVERGVLTQVLGQFDNSYQQECVARYPGRFASVGAIAVQQNGAAGEVGHWAARGMVGLRLRPDARSPGDDPFALWRAAAEYGLVISVNGPSSLLLTDEFTALARRFAEIPLVLEQLGGWTRPDCDRQAQTWAELLRLCRLPNVLLKLSTIGQIAPRQIGTPLPPSGQPVLDTAQAAILLQALEAFGAERLMWGSDYPIVSSREGYANALNWTRDIFAGCNAGEIDAIFGGNATRVFFS